MDCELKVFVSMMSAPASRYWRWMSSMMCGCVRLSRSLQTLEVLAAPIREPRAAKGRLIQLVLLDHRAHRAVNDDDAFAQQTFKMFNSVRHWLAAD